jgi:nucleotide-binding universal stress UspA family protein
MAVKILCAIDDAGHSEQAAEVAIGLAKQMSAKLVFYMVNPAVLPGRGTPVYLWKDDYIQGYLDEALRRARRVGLFDVTCVTDRATSIAEAIVICADRHDADLIVVGACNQRRVIDLIRQSVSRAVANTANCPVLTVKHVRTRRFQQGAVSSFHGELATRRGEAT